ncbi:ABC transporter permease [Georgenia sp. Z1491]|uniref:ABC transporter permease n=1 Tax=Georgenia sp. Z1491 TaxID=3416707 RepID=UPI003CE8B1B9
MTLHAHIRPDAGTANDLPDPGSDRPVADPDRVLTVPVPAPERPGRRRAGVGRRIGPATVGALRGAAPVVLSLIGIVVIWYVVALAILPVDQRFLLPPPHEVFGSTLTNPQLMEPMLDALGRSVVVAAIGLAVAVVIGILWALAMSASRWTESILYPYAVILQTIPILALVPLIGIWFGYGFPARVIVCVIIALFPMISNTFFGLQSASAAAHDLLTLNNASRTQRLVKLQLPASVPSIFTGLRTAAGLSVIGALVGDYFFQQGPVGIGGLLRTYTLRLQMDALFTAITLTALFGVVVFGLFAVLDRLVLGRWYGKRPSS